MLKPTDVPECQTDTFMIAMAGIDQICQYQGEFRVTADISGSDLLSAAFILAELNLRSAAQYGDASLCMMPMTLRPSPESAHRRQSSGGFVNVSK